jgi:ectoine hydroxylase-related dioxygenase (phytanoyl-CoA dioxygenase family)
VYLFDEAWILGTQLVEAASTMLGRPYVLAADGYAWHVPVGTGRGWEPHRDEPHLLDRRAPERVNVWFAITDATAERACVHAVPLDDDPGYPSALTQKDPPLCAVRALPVAAGTALAWNANLLHWGGPCSPRACAARMAISFTALRADAPGRIGPPRLSAEMLSPLGRLDLVASFIAGYAHYGGLDVSEEVMMWAKATCGLGRCARRLADESD